MGTDQAKRVTVKMRLQDAMATLCADKKYQDITISDICRYAGTTRSAFYLYYDSKDQLLCQIKDAYFAELRSLSPNLFAYQPDFDNQTFRIYQQEMAQMLQCFHRNPKLSLFLLTSDAAFDFQERFKRSIHQICQANLPRSGVRLPCHLHYHIEFFCNGYVSAIIDWLEREERTPEEMAAFLMKTVVLFAALCK